MCPHLADDIDQDAEVQVTSLDRLSLKIESWNCKAESVSWSGFAFNALFSRSICRVPDHAFKAASVCKWEAAGHAKLRYRFLYMGRT